MSFPRILSVAALAAAISFPVASQAATHIWGGAINGNWSTPGNWGTNLTPANNDTVILTGTFACPSTYDLVGVELAAVLVAGGGPCTVSGTPVVLAAGGTLGGNPVSTWTFASGITGMGALTLLLDTATTGNLAVTGPITGGSLTLNNSGNPAAILSVLGTYTAGGTISLTGTRTVVIAPAALTPSSVINIGGGTLNLTGSTTVTGISDVGSGNLLMDGNGVLTISGAGPSQVRNYGTNPAVPGAPALTKAGSGTLTLIGTNTFTGATSVNGGTLVLNGTSLSPTTLTGAPTAALAGTGTISAAVAANAGGSLRPGNPMGTIATGNLALNAGSSYAFNVNFGAGTSDQLNVTGSVTIDPATSWSMSTSGAPAFGQTFTLINNDGADPIAGTIGSLPQGYVLNAGASTFTFSYIAGNGNDLVMTVSSTTPAAPTIGVATPLDSSASVAFTAGAANGATISGFTATCGAFSASGTTSPIVVPGLTNGTPYSCSVIATNARGNSVASGTTSVTPGRVPDAPTLTSVTPTAVGQLTAAFTAPAFNGGSAIFQYTTTCNPGSLAVTNAAVGAIFNGLANGATYTCSTVARNAFGSGAASNSIGATTWSVPSAPVMGTVTPGAAGELTVSFTASVSNGGTAITGYSATCNPGNVVVAGSPPSIFFAGLPNGTAHTCSVVATNAVGNSAASATAGATTAGVPGAPTIGAATNTGVGQFSVAFTAPASTGGSPITSYSTTCNPGNVVVGGTSPVTFAGLANATLFTCSTTATNAIGTGAPSATTTVTTWGVPGAPTIGTAAVGNGQSQVSFTPPASNGGTPITSYTVTCGAFSATGPGTLLVVLGLANGTPYNCTVAATNAVGTGPSSAIASVTPASVPDAPTIGVVTAGNSQATVAFTPPASTGGSAITGYTATCGAFSASGAGSPLVVAGLTNGTAYGCSVAATNTQGTGPASATVNVTPVTLPGAPTIGVVTAGNAQASVAFTPPASNGGSAITSYTATCGAFSAAGPGSPIVVTGLANGSTYNCSVTATNGVGMGPASGTASVSPTLNAYSAASATGSGTITASFTGGGAACTFSTPQFIGAPPGAAPIPPTAPGATVFPHGLFDFRTIGCTAGSTVSFTITYPVALPAGTTYWKYGPTPGNTAPHWYTLPATIAGNTATFTITDGGLGDDDLAANGTIVDQGGPGVPGSPGTATAVPTLSEWMLMVLAGLMLATVVAERRRRTHSPLSS